MANYLLLNQPQVFNGVGTLTYVIPTTGAYNVAVSSTVPEAIAPGSGAGSQKGLGSGAGGGGTGFTGGDLGTGHGGVGQGFGTGNSYQQPPSYGSNQTSGSAVSTGLTIVVNDNGTPIFTAGTFTATQSAQQFKTGFLATAGHTITVVFASSTASDNKLSGVTSIVSINQGLK
jgi:hypothetical protein